MTVNRVSDRAMFAGASSRMLAARARVESATAQASSGVRVAHAGDDPTAASRMVMARFDERRQQAIVDSVSQASDELDAVDGALTQAGGVLIDAISLAVQMAGDNVNSSQRIDAAKQADSLVSQAVTALNVELAGRFLLGGFSTDQAPFAAAGYKGDDGVRTAEIAPGVIEPTSIRADQAVGGAGGGVDVLGALRDLSTALRSNDIPAVRAQIDVLHAAQTQLAAAQTEVGGRQSVMLTAVQTAAVARDAATDAHATAADADITQVASELALAQRAFEAAAQASSSTLHLSYFGQNG